MTPAHRGIAYAVFEQLQLADFGNRIPSLTFEVIADEAPVRVGDGTEVGVVGGVGDLDPHRRRGGGAAAGLPPLGEQRLAQP